MRRLSNSTDVNDLRHESPNLLAIKSFVSALHSIESSVKLSSFDVMCAFDADKYVVLLLLPLLPVYEKLLSFNNGRYSSPLRNKLFDRRLTSGALSINFRQLFICVGELSSSELDDDNRFDVDVVDSRLLLLIWLYTKKNQCGKWINLNAKIKLTDEWTVFRDRTTEWIGYVMINFCQNCVYTSCYISNMGPKSFFPNSFFF